MRVKMLTFLNNLWIYRRKAPHRWCLNTKSGPKGSLQDSSQTVFEVSILAVLQGHSTALVHEWLPAPVRHGGRVGGFPNRGHPTVLWRTSCFLFGLMMELHSVSPVFHHRFYFYLCTWNKFTCWMIIWNVRLNSKWKTPNTLARKQNPCLLSCHLLPIDKLWEKADVVCRWQPQLLVLGVGWEQACAAVPSLCPLQIIYW